MKLKNNKIEEMRKLGSSLLLKRDFINMKKNSKKFLKINNKVNIDRWIAFLTEYNKFINHRTKPFHKIKGGNFKL